MLTESNIAELHHHHGFLEESGVVPSSKNALISSLIASFIVVIGCQTLVIIFSVLLKYKRKLTLACEIGLMSLGIGAMITDAMVHIIPEALRIDTHVPHHDDHIEEHHHDEGHEGHNHSSNVLLGLSALFGMVFVLSVEFIVHRFRRRDAPVASKNKRLICPSVLAKFFRRKSIKPNVPTLECLGDKPASASTSECRRKSARKYSGSSDKNAGEEVSDAITEVCQSHHGLNHHILDNHQQCSGHGFAKLYKNTIDGQSNELMEKMFSASVSKSCAEIVHNVIDGLTIGVAFSGSRSTGISTAVSILAHEVPLQFTGYILFRKAGFKSATAILFNTALALFVVVGALVPSWTANPTLAKHLLMATAGNFIALSFIQILPEVRRNILEGGTKYLIISVCFVALGVLIICLLGVFEDRI